MILISRYEKQEILRLVKKEIDRLEYMCRYLNNTPEPIIKLHALKVKLEEIE
jgi:hypothetical protein